MIKYINNGKYRVKISSNGDRLNNHRNKEEYVKKSVYVVYDKAMQNSKEHKGRMFKKEFNRYGKLKVGNEEFTFENDTDVLYTGSLSEFNRIVKKLN